MRINLRNEQRARLFGVEINPHQRPTVLWPSGCDGRAGETTDQPTPYLWDVRGAGNAFPAPPHPRGNGAGPPGVRIPVSAWMRANSSGWCMILEEIFSAILSLSPPF